MSRDLELRKLAIEAANQTGRGNFQELAKEIYKFLKEAEDEEEGIVFDFQGDELQTHFKRRADHHKTKTRYYHDQIRELMKGGHDVHATNSPIPGLSESEREHTRKAGLFGIMADQVVIDKKYRLSEKDLVRLELIDMYL